MDSRVTASASGQTDVGEPALDQSTLRPLVRRSLGRTDVEIVDWTCSPLASGLASEPSGPFCYGGTAQTGDGPVPWALVRKVLRRPPPGAPTRRRGHLHYWRREPLAYRSGLLANPPDGFAVPRCLSAQEQPDGSIQLWLEHVAESRPDWPLARYALAARHLGRFNASYLTGRPLPTDPWLLRRYLGRYLAVSTHERTAVRLLRHSAAWRSVEAAHVFPSATRARLLDLWAALPRLAALSDGLPRTLCHFDAHRRNLFARRATHGQDQTVAIDWSAVGLGPVGADAGYLAAATAVFDGTAGVQPAAFADAIFAGYLEGLRDAGWRGDPTLVRLGFLCMAVGRWALNAAGLVLEPLVTDDASARAETERWWGRPLPDLLERWVPLTVFLLDRADEARRLAADLALT